MRAAVPLVLAAVVLAACGPQPSATPGGAKAPAAKTGRTLPTGPQLSGLGTVAAVEGKLLTLDHDAVPGGLAAGRHVFEADAAALAEAPLEPGARIAFSYQDWTPQPLLTELKAR